jgi:hypothetical protein
MSNEPAIILICFSGSQLDFISQGAGESFENLQVQVSPDVSNSANLIRPRYGYLKIIPQDYDTTHR